MNHNTINLNNPEQKAESSSNPFTNTEFEPWDESKRPTKAAETEQISPEDARKEVLKALGKKPDQQLFSGSEMLGTQRIDTEVVLNNMNEEKNQLQANVPDDINDIDQWIDDINNLPDKYASNLSLEINNNANEQDLNNLDYLKAISQRSNFDTTSYYALSQKHNHDMKASTREKMYSSLGEYINNNNGIGAEDLLSQIRQNIISLDSQNSANAAESKTVEQAALRTFEEIALKFAPELKESEKTALLESTQKTINALTSALNSLARAASPKERQAIKQKITPFTHKQNPSSSEIEMMVSDLEDLKDNPDELFDQGKRLKFLYRQAKREKNHVSGFGNNRKLKKQPEYFLPDDFEEVIKTPSAYSEDKLRDLALKYASMR